MKIDETKELVGSLIKGYEAYEKIAEDKKVNLNDLPTVIGVLPVLIDGFKDVKTIGEEIKDMTEEERVELVDYFANEFDLENEEAEVAVEKAFAMLTQAGKFGVEVIGFIKSLKKAA